MLITIWTLPNCVQCEATKRQMSKLGIRYEVMNLEQHPEMLEQFKAQGLSAAPIVVTDIKKWSGYRHEKIASLAKYLSSEQAKNEH